MYYKRYYVCMLVLLFVYVFFRHYIIMLVLFFVYIFFEQNNVISNVLCIKKKISIYVNYHNKTPRQNVSIRNSLRIHFILVKMITWITAHHKFFVTIVIYYWLDIPSATYETVKFSCAIRGYPEMFDNQKKMNQTIITVSLR